jgi:2-dehydropantoate 2-reductase
LRVAIMGAGGIGGYYGGRLAQAGHDVVFIARGEHLRAIQANGLTLLGPAGETHVASARATEDPGKLDPVDVVLFCVKLFDTEGAAEPIKPLLEKGGVCISLQNGVDGAQRIGAVLGHERVMAGIAFVSALIESPGVIRYKSKSPSISSANPTGERRSAPCASGMPASRPGLAPRWSQTFAPRYGTNSSASRSTRR